MDLDRPVRSLRKILVAYAGNDDLQCYFAHRSDLPQLKCGRYTHALRPLS